MTVLKTNIRILEIEPCASYELTSDTVKGWISNSALSEATITIDQITTAEFIGKIEDLNGIYDLIYIGTNTGRMNLKSDGSTKFNDETMDGLVYYHMGDLVNVKGELAGLLDTELNASGKINATTFAMRYSGNDITKDKYNALKDYVMASYPVVLSDDFYHTDGSINDNKISVDTGGGGCVTGFGGITVKVSPITAVTKLAGTSTQVEQDNLSPDHTYEITVPTSYLKSGKNSVTIYIEAQSAIYSYGSTKTTEKTYDTVGLVRTQLFDLK